MDNVTNVPKENMTIFDAMKLTCGLILLAAWSLVASINAAEPIELEKNDLLGRVNSCGSCLFDLAWERFMHHDRAGETWILVAELGVDRQKFSKFTDGKNTVAVIPALEISLEGLRTYVSQYNALTTRKADKLALGGKHDEALVIFQLLKRFDTTASAEIKAELDSRIECVKNLKAGKEVDAQIAKLKELTNDYGSLSAFEILESAQAKKVGNLLEVDLLAQDQRTKP